MQDRPADIDAQALRVPHSDLRARKKVRCRRAIELAALELFCVRGFDGTSVATVAEAADVAPRTVFAHFATKEALVLAPVAALTDDLTRRLMRGPPQPMPDLVRALVATVVVHRTDGPRLSAMRAQIVGGHAGLQARHRGLFAGVERALAHALARTLDLPDDDERIALAAAATASILAALHARVLAAPLDARLLDAAVSFVEGGLQRIAAGPPMHGR